MAFGYPQPDQPKHFIDYNKCTPVTVMVNFAPNGKMLPIYIRWTYPDQSEETIKIDAIKFTRDKGDCISFYCLFNNHGRQQEVILTFYVMECRWVVE